MRLFFAVNLSEQVRKEVVDALAAFPLARPPWRWVGAENLHITLKFLGERAEDELDDLVASARTAAGAFAPFGFRLGAFGGFPSIRRPRVLFYQVEEGSRSLCNLADKLEGVLAARMGIARENRPFRAHLTVARVKGTLDRSAREAIALVPPLRGTVQEVHSFFLMESELRREGARYRVLKEIELVGGK